MSQFNFKSQICTSRSQSEQLLALGLKPETADMCWALETTYDGEDVEWFCHIGTFTKEDADIAFYDYIPAWSLHRLIEMIQTVFLRVNLCGWWVHIERRVYGEEYVADAHNNLYDNLCDCKDSMIGV